MFVHKKYFLMVMHFTVLDTNTHTYTHTHILTLLESSTIFSHLKFSISF